MNAETLYATATTGNLKLKVPVGEIETPDGTVFDTTMRGYAPAPKETWKNYINLSSRIPGEPKPNGKQIRERRKRERVNRKRGRS